MQGFAEVLEGLASTVGLVIHVRNKCKHKHITEHKKSDGHDYNYSWTLTILISHFYIKCK